MGSNRDTPPSTDYLSDSSIDLSPSNQNADSPGDDVVPCASSTVVGDTHTSDDPNIRATAAKAVVHSFNNIHSLISLVCKRLDRMESGMHSMEQKFTTSSRKTIPKHRVALDVRVCVCVCVCVCVGGT